MPLTTEQKAIFKTNVESDPVLSLLAPSNASANIIMDAYNTVGDFIVWRSSTPIADVFEAITWKKLTPEDAPDGTAAYTNISLACQGRQFNIQTMLMGQPSIASNKTNIRQGLNDALTDVPSGVGGATQAAGWVSVKTTMSRAATRAEVLFATGTGTSASPGDLVFEGMLTQNEVTSALGGAW